MTTTAQARRAIADQSTVVSRLDDDGYGFTEDEHKAALRKFETIDATMTNAQVVRATEYIRALSRAHLA